MTDREIIALYQERDERAIEETNKKYNRYCFSIAKNILYNIEDSEESVNDTWLRVWNAIPPEVPKHFQGFLAKIVRNISFDKYKARKAKKRGNGQIDVALDELEECISGLFDVEEEYVRKELEKTINEFLWKLPERDSNLFVRRYFFTESIASIAKRYKMKENNVTVNLSRTRKKIKDYLVEEGYFL